MTNVSCLWPVEGGNGVVGDQLSVTSKHATAWIQSGDINDTTTKATTEILIIKTEIGLLQTFFI